ncbi:MAG TPA: glycosyltransferase family 4 protein [Thermoanaerobaculia bacterium]|nr:glycosyltransferase family 4 protein [Thermoanaerobaculia bacterium]
MKIAYIEPAGKGGMIHYAFQLCRALQATGADVTLITDENYELEDLDHPFRLDRSMSLWDPKPEGRQSNAWWAVTFRKLRRIGRAVRYYREWLRVARRVKELDPDVVLLGDIRFPFDLLPLLRLRRKARLFADICHNVQPFVTSGGKSAGMFDRSRWRQFFYRRIYHLFDLVFVHFDRNRGEFMQTFGVPEKRIGVIVHGNEEIFRELRAPGSDAAALRKRAGLGAEEPVVLFFGTLSRYKGIDVLLDAFPQVLKNAKARLVIVGYPTADFDLAAHQEQARRNGIADSVVWLPEYIASGDIAAWMELASVIVFPYREIYQSGALHVPQTFGVPIVASAIGAMQDVIENEVSGLLVEKENPAALAEALTRLLTDRELAARLGFRAAADAQGRFSWRAIADTIVSRSRAALR